MRVVLCEPGKLARITEIGTSLPDLQAAVDGYIEAIYCDYFNQRGFSAGGDLRE